MSSKIRKRKLNTAMLEIIMTLAILMVVSVFILKLFLGANSLETKARDISKATILSQTMVESIKGYGTVEEAVKSLELLQVQNNHSVSMYEKYYDSEWKACDKPSVYRVTISIRQEKKGVGVMVTADIKIVKEKKYAIIQNIDHRELSNIQVKSYKPGV